MDPPAPSRGSKWTATIFRKRSRCRPISRRSADLSPLDARATSSSVSDSWSIMMFAKSLEIHPIHYVARTLTSDRPIYSSVTK